MNRNLLIFWLITLSLPMPALATDTGYPTDSELSSLPGYCQIKLRQKPGDLGYNSWLGILGPDFIHTHHFCAGLNFINRHYRASSEYDRKYYLQASLPEFAYMITHAAPSYSLMPDVYINRGTVLSKLGRSSEAVADFLKAIELNPRLPKAYTVMADLYVNIKLQGKALATITEGLRYVPSSKMLQRRYAELGGKPPFPEPYADAVVTQETQAAKAREPGPAQTSEPAEASPKAALESKPGAETPNAQPAAAEAEAIGMPGNPWCRFCPDPAPSANPVSKPVPPTTGTEP
ncbi:MAG: hypothetical protein C3F18_00310 [Nitrosomonadales bacterium]|nr:MAG: hypothetical protein C3F18_00310 [Nitrosomonadales bacterium]